MNHKVLLADDSLTIQKVIKITLANQPYDITDCSNEDELFQKLTVVEPKIVFLDFNLSEKYTGYELTTKIKSALPSCKVLLLLGTFDSVDDAAMEKCGASDKIVKPFDSNRFISICAQLVDTFAEETVEEYSEPEEDEEILDDEEEVTPLPISKEDKTAEFVVDDLDSQWQVGHSISQIEKVEEVEEKPLDNSFPGLNPLAMEISDWGMSVPGVINDKSHGLSMELPPVITESKAEASTPKAEVASNFDAKFPESDDLDYPTIEEMTAAPVKEEEPKKPNYVSAANLIDINEDENFGLELENHFTAQEDNVLNIEDQIKDEIEENLWHVDEFEDLKREVSSKIEAMQDSFDSNTYESLNLEAAAEIVSDDSYLQQPAVPQASKAETEAMVKKYVQEYMDENFKKIVEKIAWDVIPDLAENLIRQELSKISQKIMNEEN